MGLTQFRFIKSDGTRPEMTVGGDINAYQKNMVQYQNAWKRPEDQPPEDQVSADRGASADLGAKVSDSILAQIQSTYARGRWPSRCPRLIKSD